jgi:hypothetical protein
LTFVDKQYFAGVGKFKVEVPTGTRFVVMEVRAGWKRWADGKVAEFVTEVHGHYHSASSLAFWTRPNGRAAPAVSRLIPGRTAERSC